MPIVDAGSHIPNRSQYGVRWRHTGEHLETAVSYFDGPNHLPDIQARLVPGTPSVPVTPSDPGTPSNPGTPSGLIAPSGIELTRVYPTIRMFGGDAAIPTSWVTLKMEAAYATSPSHSTNEYVLYAIEAERQTGEWLLDLGYAGDVVTREEPVRPFAPDRGVARSIIGRAAYTIDPRRTVTLEGAVRQGGEGFYTSVEYSFAMGQQWRLTLTGGGIGGNVNDFLGQYRRNSNGSVALRFNF